MSSRNNGRTTTRCAGHSRKGAEAVRHVKEDAGEKVRETKAKKRAARLAAISDPKQVQKRVSELNRGKAAFFDRHFRSSKNRPDDVAAVENSGNEAPIRAGDLAESDSNEGEDKNSFITVSHPVVDRGGGGALR